MTEGKLHGDGELQIGDLYHPRPVQARFRAPEHSMRSSAKIVQMSRQKHLF